MIDLGPELQAWFTSENVQEQFKRFLQDAVREQFVELLDGELIDVSQAAQLLSMSEGAVRKAVERRCLPCHRIGRRVRFRRSELLGIGR